MKIFAVGSEAMVPAQPPVLPNGFRCIIEQVMIKRDGHRYIVRDTETNELAEYGTDYSVQLTPTEHSTFYDLAEVK